MNELVAAREFLPFWVRLGPWLIGPALGLLGAVVVTALLRPPTFPPGAEPAWWERARVVFPRRQLVVSMRVLVVVSALAANLLTARAWVTDNGGRFAFTIVTAWAGAALASVRFEARLRGQPWLVVLRSFVALGVALYSPIYLVMLSAEVATVRGPLGWALSLAGVGAVAWLASGGGPVVARWLGLARPPSERVQAAADRASARVGVSARGLHEVDTLQVNAFAYPLARRVAVTRALVEAMSVDELEAILAHELGHLAEPLASRLFRPLALAAIGVVAFVVPRLPSAWVSVPALLGGMVLLLLLMRRVARAGERHADAHAKDEAGVYPRALERVYALNLVPAVLRRAGAHGHLYDRLVAAGQAPTFPRPPPPPRGPLGGRLAVALCLVPVAWALFFSFDSSQRTPGEASVALALGDASGWTVEVLARDAAQARRFDEALSLYRAADALSPGEPFLVGALVVALVNAGHCEEARFEMARLEELAGERTLRSDEDQALALARWAVEGCPRE